MAVNQNPGPVGQVPEFLGVMDLDSPKYGNNDRFHVKHIEFSSWDSIPQTWWRTTARPHLTNTQIPSSCRQGCSLSFFHKLIACSEYRWGAPSGKRGMEARC